MWLRRVRERLRLPVDAGVDLAPLVRRATPRSPHRRERTESEQTLEECLHRGESRTRAAHELTSTRRTWQYASFMTKELRTQSLLLI